MKQPLNNQRVMPSGLSFSRSLLAAGFLCMLALMTTTAKAADENLLSSERWESKAEGVSLLPPLGTQLLQLTGDDAILRIGHPEGYRITLYVKASTREITLDEVVDAAAKQLATASILVKKEDYFKLDINGHPATGFSFAATKVKDPAVMVQIYTMISDKKVLIIELNSPLDGRDKTGLAFDQMVKSIEIADPQKLFDTRKKELTAGLAWLETVTPEMVHNSLIKQQLFRMVAGTTEMGYMSVAHRTTTTLSKPGVQIDIQARLVINNVTYDTLSNYFASDVTDPKERVEVWSVRTTSRPQTSNRNSNSDSDSSWAETGLLSKGTLTLTRESPSEKKPFQWTEMPPGYISQAFAQLLPSLMKPDQKETLAFYAYYGNSGKIALRTERVEAAKDGSYKVFSRPSPDQEEQVTWFDAKGVLIRRVLPGGQVLLPATAAEISARWKMK